MQAFHVFTIPSGSSVNMEEGQKGGRRKAGHTLCRLLEDEGGSYNAV